MIELDNFAERLYDKIRIQGSDIAAKDKDKKPIKNLDDIGNARYFQFKYADSLDIVMQIDEGSGGNLGTLIVMYDGSLPDAWNDDQKSTFREFLKNLKKFCQPNLSFTVRDISKSRGLDATNVKFNAANKSVSKDEIDAPAETVAESKLTGTKRRSYERNGSIRIIAKHKKDIDEEQRGARSRNIECIYVETDLGERFRLPEGTSLNGARAYARHMLEGGTLHDDFGQHITKMIKEMNDLKLFVRNMRGKQFEDEETNKMVEAAIDHYGSMHRDLFMLRGRRGYSQYKELWQPEQPLTDDFDMDSLKERFVRRVFDERLSDALPIVHRAYETKKSRLESEFEEWANRVVEGEYEDENENYNNLFSTEMDSDEIDDKLEKLFDENKFEYSFEDGVIYFESLEELSRAKDILAKYALDNGDTSDPFPEMRVKDPTKAYGASTFDRDLKHGTMESILRLAGIAK